jgi:hypothetical protein
MAGWRGMVLGNAKAIDAILKVKSYHVFRMKEQRADVWFDSMNEFTKNAAF